MDYAIIREIYLALYEPKDVLNFMLTSKTIMKIIMSRCLGDQYPKYISYEFKGCIYSMLYSFENIKRKVIKKDIKIIYGGGKWFGTALNAHSFYDFMENYDDKIYKTLDLKYNLHEIWLDIEDYHEIFNNLDKIVFDDVVTIYHTEDYTPIDTLIYLKNNIPSKIIFKDMSVLGV